MRHEAKTTLTPDWISPQDVACINPECQGPDCGTLLDWATDRILRCHKCDTLYRVDLKRCCIRRTTYKYKQPEPTQAEATRFIKGIVDAQRRGEVEKIIVVLEHVRQGKGGKPLRTRQGNVK